MHATVFGAENMLVKPTVGQAALVRSGTARVRVENGAAAMVIAHNGQTVVLGLHDRATGDVSVAIGASIVNLRAGEAVVFQNNSDCINAVGVLSHLPIRLLRTHGAAMGTATATCEFSLPAAMLLIEPIHALNSSSNSADRALYAKILKNASVIQIVGSVKGNYQTLKTQRQLVSIK